MKLKKLAERVPPKLLGKTKMVDPEKKDEMTAIIAYRAVMTHWRLRWYQRLHRAIRRLV